jgi:hypothetical protein
MNKPGIYESIYGNAVEVEDWDSDTAWDLDMREEIPIEFVTNIFLREIE